MKTKTLAWLGGVGLGLGLAAGSFVSCSEPPPTCQVGLNSPYIAVLTPTKALPACAQQNPVLLQTGDTFGMEFYNAPAADAVIVDGGLSTGDYNANAISMAVVSDTMATLQIAYSDKQYPDGTIPGAAPGTPSDPVFFTDNIPGHTPYGGGPFTAATPDSNDFCYVPTVTSANEDFSQMDGGAPNPNVKVGESWSNMTFYVTAAVQGDQFKGTLTRTINGCSVEYNAIGLWPGIPCTGADMKDNHSIADLAQCSPCANPDAGMAVGSGINPNFPIQCAAVYNPADPFGRGGACMNLSADPNNCGACGNVCPAYSVCSSGSCGSVCATGATVCTPPKSAMMAPFCAELSNDPANCGSCFNACKSGEVCSGGKCAAKCGTGLTTCTNPTTMAPGCSDLTNDAANCGMCNNACTNGSCAAGKCTCSQGLTLCGGSLCTDTSTDSQNCGGCGTACGAGQSCSAGKCVTSTTCPSGEAQCGGSPFYCVLTGHGDATGNSTLPQLNSEEPACANSSNEN
jgi:hypothetical protein